MTANDYDYYARRDELRAVLRQVGPTTVAHLHDVLGWSSPELTAKLMSLRGAGYATYDGERKHWHATNIRRVK